MKREEPMTDLTMAVLVVDDLPAMRRIAKSCLTQLGFTNVVEASDASQAVDRLKSENISFVITDCHLPDIDTHTMLEQFRAASAKKELPILMVACAAQREHAIHELYESHTQL
ncbi:MAG: response regulator, partial [Proteobacteria bacterium]|nr:response regulator [Pseudomonadota bacterium]